MINLFDLTGKVAVVTGASSGIGAQLAKQLGEQGADVVLVARRLEKLQIIAEEIKQLGRKVLAVKCDVTKEEDVMEAVALAIKEFGKIDILVNNAGVEALGSVENVSIEDWNKILDTNLNGTFIMSKHVVASMKDKNYGRIINTASVLGFVGMKQAPYHAYAASKGGVIGMTRSMAASLAQYGITVNAIAPGLFESEMTTKTFANDEVLKRYSAVCPACRAGKSGELNGAVVYFASDAASYTTGQVLAIDGGWTSI